MGSCWRMVAVKYCKKQIGEVCGKSSKYAKEMDDIEFYNTPKNGYANSCKIFYDNCVLHACTDPSYDDDPEGAKWTALYMLNEPQSAGANDGAGCAQSVRMYQAMDRWYTDEKDYQVGDEIYYRRNSAVSSNNPLGVYHTGMIVDWGEFDEGEGFKVVEGNTNGGYVAEKFYPFGDSRIAGVGRPRWDGNYPDDSTTEKPEKPEEPETPAEPEPIGKEYTVSVNSWLNVRHGVGTNYPVVDKLYNGDKVTVYEEKNGWGRISTEMDIWVSMDYLN